jgi:hypothetical protein
MGLLERSLAEVRRARVWQGICLLIVLFWVVDHWVTLASFGRDQRVILLDGEGTYYVGSLRTADREKEALADVARLAAETAFNRGPEGYLAPERMNLLFGKEARAELQQSAATDSQEFRTNRIYQMVDVGKITQVRDESKEEIVMSAQCLRVRTRNYEGTLEEEKTPLTLLMRLKVNRYTDSNGMYPYVCIKFKITNPE